MKDILQHIFSSLQDAIYRKRYHAQHFVALEQVTTLLFFWLSPRKCSVNVIYQFYALNCSYVLKNQFINFSPLEDSSPPRIKEKMQLAQQGVMDNSNFAIAIAVGIFGVLTLFVQIAGHKPLFPTDWIIWITLTVSYWVLIVLGTVAHAHHRMNVAIIETYIKDRYQQYKEDMKNATRGNWIMTLAIKRFWLDKPTEKVNKFSHHLLLSNSIFSVPRNWNIGLVLPVMIGNIILLCCKSSNIAYYS